MTHPDRRILVWPPPEDANPYVRRLVDALAQRGVAARSHPRLAALCARPGGASWLHLHWPEWMTHDRSALRYRARVRWQHGLLDLARSQGLRLAWTAHNLVGHDDPHPALGLEARRGLLARCDVVVGHFAEAESDLRAMGFRGRFVAAAHPPFADEHPEPFADAGARLAWRRSMGVADDVTLLASPGSMEPYKNLPALAQALRDIDDSKVMWIAAGRAPPHALRALEEAVAGDRRVRVLPRFQTRAELAALCAGSDAILLGHRDFYTSGAAVLGAAMGAPVIAPPRHHLAAWTSEPFFVPLPVVDGDALRGAVAAVRRMGAGQRAAARSFARRFGWAQMAAALDGALFGEAA